MKCLWTTKIITECDTNWTCMPSFGHKEVKKSVDKKKVEQIVHGLKIMDETSWK